MNGNRREPPSSDRGGFRLRAHHRGWFALAIGLSVAVTTAAHARGEPQRANAPVVEILTIGPGDSVFERFGHAAICLRYPGKPADNVCLNYGDTDFSRPASLTWDFLRGKAKFWVTPSSPSTMVGFYRSQDRTIWRQELPLTSAEARAIEEKLRFDLDEPNRVYVYHHYFDNCTTRIRDLIDAAVGGKLREGSGTATGRSFREISRDGFAERHWLLAMSDVFLGRDADRSVSIWDSLFLPVNLRDRLEETLGAAPVLMYERRGGPLGSNTPSERWRFFAFGLLLALIAGLPRYLRRRGRWGLGIAVLPLGLIGAVIWGVAAITPLSELRYNEALFVFVPFDVLLPFWSERRRRRYAQLRVGVLLVVAVLSIAGVFVQPLWGLIALAFGPLAIAALR